MANWNEIKSGVGRAADKTIKKASELADTASMHIKLKSMNVKLKDKFETLGRLTYKQLKTGRSQAEAISSVIEDIDALRDEIKAQKQKIEDAKEERAKKPEDVNVDYEEEEAEAEAENEPEDNE